MAEEQSYKTEGGKRYPRKDFALNEGEPSSWKLRLTSTPGGPPDPHIVGAAVAALGKGFRGNTVEIPANKLGAVKAKVLAAWRRCHPSHKPEDIPAVLKAAVDGKAPPGWTKTVERMKKTGGIDNPFALAWYMKNRGMHPHKPQKAEADAASDALIAQALREVDAQGLPATCLAAARGEWWAEQACSTTTLVLERRRP